MISTTAIKKITEALKNGSRLLFYCKDFQPDGPNFHAMPKSHTTQLLV